MLLSTISTVYVFLRVIDWTKDLYLICRENVDHIRWFVYRILCVCDLYSYPVSLYASVYVFSLYL